MNTNHQRTPPGADPGTREVLALLEEQRELCRELAGFADRQAPLITGNETERLLQVLADRQKVLDRMTAVAGRLRPYQQDWRAVRGRMSPAEATRADALVAEVNAGLAAILQRDEASAELLAARKSAAARSLGELRQARQVGTAYAAAGAGGGPSLDWADQ